MGVNFFWTASYIKQCISNLQWKLWWCEDYKSDSTSRYVTEAYSEQMNSVHIIVISFKEKYMANLYFIKHTTVEMSPHGRIQTTCAMIQGCRKVVH